jgi:predicted nucleic acid-binding protein
LPATCCPPRPAGRGLLGARADRQGSRSFLVCGGAASRCLTDGFALSRCDVGRLFGRRLLDFDPSAAQAYAQITRATTVAGTLLPLADGLIAAIAHTHNSDVATRDVEPFRAAGIEVVDPWRDA